MATDLREQTLTIIQQLSNKRDEIDRAIDFFQSAVAVMPWPVFVHGDLEELGFTTVSTTDVPETEVRRHTVPNVVRQLLDEQGQAAMPEIMAALRRARNASKPESVTSILSRMVAKGQIAKGPERGTFRRMPDPPDERLAERELAGAGRSAAG